VHSPIDASPASTNSTNPGRLHELDVGGDGVRRPLVCTGRRADGPDTPMRPVPDSRGIPPDQPMTGTAGAWRPSAALPRLNTTTTACADGLADLE
jgi:hypothetical protein